MGFPTFLYRNRRIWWFTIGLPTLSGVLPTNKNIPPPIRKPQSIYSDLFLLLAAFALAFFLQGLDQDCIASGFLIHLWQMLLVQKRHPKNDWFLIKKSLNRILLGARKGYPPWVVSSPQIIARAPQLENPSPSIQIFSFCWLPLQLLSFGKTALACTVLPTRLVSEALLWLGSSCWQRGDLLPLQELCLH